MAPIWSQNSPVCNSAVVTVVASAGLGPNGGEDGVDNGEDGEQAAWQGARLQGGCQVMELAASWLSWRQHLNEASVPKAISLICEKSWLEKK